MAFMLWNSSDDGSKKIFLTFDDGPNGVATVDVLDVLDTYKIKASFFLIGKNVERDTLLAKRIADQGHVIGNHGYGLGNTLFLCSKDTIKRNLELTNKILFDAAGVLPKYFRPPNGLINRRIEAAANELAMKPVGVHIFVRDSFKKDAHKIATKVLAKVKTGSYIIVLHDGFGIYQKKSRRVVAEALEIIINELNDRDFSWHTLDAWTCS